MVNTCCGVVAVDDGRAEMARTMSPPATAMSTSTEMAAITSGLRDRRAGAEDGAGAGAEDGAEDVVAESVLPAGSFWMSPCWARWRNASMRLLRSSCSGSWDAGMGAFLSVCVE